MTDVPLHTGHLEHVELNWGEGVVPTAWLVFVLFSAFQYE